MGMRIEAKRGKGGLWLACCLVAGAGVGPVGCGDDARVEPNGPWEALMGDGDLGTIAGATTAPATMTPTMTPPPPPRFCSDCSREPLAYWTLDDCNPNSTQLNDFATTSGIQHPAFRAVSVACVAGASGQGAQLGGVKDDILYAPDQPDFVFDQGLTIAAWVKVSSLNGTQSLVRKRFDGNSAFTLALDDKKLTFVVRLTSGKLVGVTAAIKADRLTHIAATYDGQRAQLYVDGALAGRTNGAGKIAPGAGPILIGNDADGRQYKGLIDEIWLNTLAAPADTVAALTCLRQAPIASLSPATTPATPPNTPVAFDLAITNPSGASCPADQFEFFGQLPFPLTADQTFGFVSIAPGQTTHVPVNVSAFDGSVAGPVSFQYFVGNTANFNLQTTASAAFVVAPAPPPPPPSCPATPSAPVAPGGYYVAGNAVCTMDGRAHTIHGVDRPSLEWMSTGDHISLPDFQLMATWKANAVRIALNQDFWLPGSPLFDPSYIDTVDNAVAWAEMAGMDVILDLHWSDQGVLGSCPPSAGCQQLMPDTNSQTFWSQVATHFRFDGRVMFELYNEPHDVDWNTWRNGGQTFQGWVAVGMQQLYDTVRAAGADNIVVIGGLNWAYDLSGVPANRIAGYNIVYATHPYTDTGGFTRPPSDWGRAFGFLTATDPVIATEFGVLNDVACTTGYDAQLISYLDAHFAGFTAWAWFPGGCTFPALINDWAGTPSPTGAVVQAALLGYPADPPASPPRALGPDVNFTFGHGPQGWAFDLFDDASQTNLAVHPSPGFAAPTLTINATDGAPDPGSLQVTAHFTAFHQYVDPDVNFFSPRLNLTGKVLHARIRLVSGTFDQGAFQFHASTGDSFVYASTFFNGTALPLGVWVPVDLDLSTVTAPGYDPTQVVQIGVQFLSGFGSGTYVDTGDTVFEIDTVTD
jgi:endoglucanase